MSGSASLPTVSDLDWGLAAVADFDGDGSADLLWRHRVYPGENVIWLMNGTSISAGRILPEITDHDWEVVGPR